MNCNNTNCKKSVRNYNYCEDCFLIYCSTTCLNEHKRDLHGFHYSEKNHSTNSNYKSIFIKPGVYEKEIIDDPYFDFSNFDFSNPEKKKRLGSGAFGDVYLAANKIDNKLYAIKVMDKKKIVESGATLDIIHREISIHRKIKHDNVVRVFSHFENDDYFYLIMEYINSGSLFSVIKKNKGIDERKAFWYFIQACSAVHFLHANNLIHRDLKPENILIDDKDLIKLCDFGWCVDISEGNRVTFCGTYEYMAPEIVKELPYNYEIDVWSLGILLFELTHGYSPFRAEKDDGEDYQEIFMNIIKYKFKIEKDLSKGCVDLIQRLLTPDNRKRINIKEIFNHPWVIQMENEIKDEMRKESEKANNSISNSTNASESSKSISQQKTPPINKDNTTISDSYNIETLKQEIKNETIRLKLESKKNYESNYASEVIDKVNSKEKIKKIKSKDKSKKLDLKTKSEKLIINNNTSINTDNFDSNGEKVAKKKLVRKKTEKSLLENNNKKEVSKEDYKSNDKKTLDSSSSFAININNYKDKSNILNLDISALNPKNDYSNKISDSRIIFDISPDRLKNSGNFMQGDNSKLSTFNFNEIEDKNNITNLRDLNAFNEEHNQYFDNVLDNIQKKNRDKATKKNKNIHKLLNSVNANLVNSKIYGVLDKSSLDRSNINLNYQQSLGTSHSEVYFDKKSPLKYSDLNNSKIDNDPNKLLVSSKHNKKNNNNDLFEIAEEKKKRKKSSESKRKQSSNLDKENDLNFEKNTKPKKRKKEEGMTLNLDRSSDEEESTKRKKLRENLHKNDLIQNLDDKNLKNFIKENSLTRNKTSSDLINNRNTKSKMIYNMDVKDLDKQLNLDFLPKDLLYNDITYDNSSKKMLESMEILEKAKMQKLKENENNYENKENQEEIGFWDNLFSMLNPFKCANYGNPN